MGLSDLDTIDLVAGPPDGDHALWIMAEGWPPEREALDYVQLMIKLTGVLAYVEQLGQEGRRSTVLLHSTAEPPASVLEFARERGIAAMVGVGGVPHPATGRHERFPNLHDGSPDLAALQGANAERFAAEHGLDGTIESLTLLDDALEERRRVYGLLPDDVDEDFTDGDLTVLAGAYAGEVLRHHTREATWWLGSAGNSGPLHLRAGLGLGTRVDALGRVRDYLRHGPRASVHTLISTLATRLRY